MTIKKIIIVDTFRSIIVNRKSILSRGTFKIFLASSFEHVLKIHREERADLIIADLDKPGMEGDRLCEMIRSDENLRNVSFIITCSSDEESIRRCKECGANVFLLKPLDAEELSHHIMRIFHISERESMRVLMKISVKGESENKFFFSTSRNISASGVLIVTDYKLSEGDKVICSFFIGSNQIKTDGEVVRVSKESFNVLRYGIRFINLDLKLKKLIEEFIENRRNI
jgi:DNA-binding response OmpR family regulator